MGLKTRWKDFYKDYLNDTENDSIVIENFKNLILKDKENEWGNWSDFELGMGKESKNFNSKEEIVACHADFVNKFKIYIRNECDKIDWRTGFWGHKDEYRDSFYNSICNFLKNTNDKYELNFLQFNYTDILDKILMKTTQKFDQYIKINENLHLHGEIGTCIVIGVDNAWQIDNEILRNDDEINEILIKQEYLKFVNAIKGEKLNNIEKARGIIHNSDIICIFGSSIGETDAYWWEIIGDWLKEKIDNSLYIFNGKYWSLRNKTPTEIRERGEIVTDKRLKILNKFISLANWSEVERKLYKGKITITLNSDMFNFELPMKETVEVLV
jgi:hypothetical protein